MSMTVQFGNCFLSEGPDPSANIRCDEVHQSESSEEFEFVDHKSRVGEDEVHLCKGKGGLEDGIDSNKNRIAGR